MLIHGQKPASVFQLRGTDENSATYALGWALEQSAELRKVFVRAVFGKDFDVYESTVALQAFGADDRGYTDLQIQFGVTFHAILEAKKGWDAPGEKQLMRYAGRLLKEGAANQRIVTVSAATAELAARQLPKTVQGIPVRHLSWTDLQRLARTARSQATSLEEKFWLKELITHLQEYVGMERQIDNRVHVVSLGKEPMVEGKNHTWIDVVEKDASYFHPVGQGFPAQPVNYVGFRYDGRLQSVHHVDSYKVVVDVSQVNPKWLQTDRDHFVYRLGPPMRPAKPVRTGNIFRNGRVWCAIDTLLSGAYETISAARDETKRRQDQVT